VGGGDRFANERAAEGGVLKCENDEDVRSVVARSAAEGLEDAFPGHRVIERARVAAGRAGGARLRLYEPLDAVKGVCAGFAGSACEHGFDLALKQQQVALGDGRAACVVPIASEEVEHGVLDPRGRVWSLMHREVETLKAC
jgi:hypothetical protein